MNIGACNPPIDAIAALACVCRTSAKNAVREARRFGLIRRTPGGRSLIRRSTRFASPRIERRVGWQADSARFPPFCRGHGQSSGGL
jgi:hypothetical protein